MCVTLAPAVRARSAATLASLRFQDWVRVLPAKTRSFMGLDEK
jgi:hypothetical protein